MMRCFLSQTSQTLLMWGKFWGVFSAKWPRGVLLAVFLPASPWLCFPWGSVRGCSNASAPRIGERGVSMGRDPVQPPLCPRDLPQPSGACPSPATGEVSHRSSFQLQQQDLGAAVVFRIPFPPTTPSRAAVLGHPGWISLPVPQVPSPGSWGVSRGCEQGLVPHLFSKSLQTTLLVPHPQNPGLQGQSDTKRTSPFQPFTLISLVCPQSSTGPC